MALLSIGMDFKRPLRLLALVVVFGFLLFRYNPLQESRYSWMLPMDWSLNGGYRPDILQYVNPLIGTINGGELVWRRGSGREQLCCLAGREINSFYSRPRLSRTDASLWYVTHL